MNQFDDRSEGAVAVARRFLDAAERRDFTEAESLLARGFVAIYPGGRHFADPKAVIEAGSKRYRNVKKRYEAVFEIPADAEGLSTVIFSGTLVGAWADGEGFDGIRFTDRFRLRNGQIVEQQVWNDIGEALLARSNEKG